MKKLLKVSFVGPANSAWIHWCALSLAYFAGVNNALTNKVKKKKMQSLKKEKKTKKRRKTQTPTFSSVSKRYLSMPLFKITRGSFGSPFQATF